MKNKDYLFGNCDSEKWDYLFLEIAEWKEQYLIKSKHITLDGIDGWYMELFIGEFIYTEVDKLDLETYLSTIMLINWTLSFCEDDYYIDKHSNFGNNFRLEFDYPKECCVMLEKKP